MTTPECWTRLVNGRLSLRADKLTVAQLDEVRAVLNEQGFDDGRLTFAANAVATCLNDEHKLDLLRHLLLHGHEYRDPNRPKPKPRDRDTERMERHADMLASLRHANDQAFRLGFPTAAEPVEWLKLVEPVAPTEEDAKALLRKLNLRMDRKFQRSARETWRGIKAALLKGQSRESVLAQLKPYHTDADAVVAEIVAEIAKEKA